MTISEGEFGLMERQAKIIVESGLLPKTVNTWQKAVVIMMQGRELGIGTMASLRGIDVIQGQPAVKPQLMLALIHRSDLLDDMRIEDDGQACRVTMTRKGREPHTEMFSVADAERMQTTEWENNQKKTIKLSEKYNWKQMPEVMRKWRAVAACARVVFPDLILGLYMTEELGEAVIYDDGGEVIIDEHGEVVTPDVKPARTEDAQEPNSMPAAQTPRVPIGRTAIESAPDDPPADLVTGRNGEDDHDPVRETPAVAQEVAEDPRMDKRPLTSNIWLDYLLPWLMQFGPGFRDTHHAGNTLILALKEEKLLGADESWSEIYALGISVQRCYQAIDNHYTKAGQPS
jgi:hypothetical protein